MLAIIPARGGSKRLPGKNVKMLNDQPLIAYTIKAALESKYISKVIVSTDCEMIAKVAVKFGAKVPELRPAYLSSDTASSNDVLLFTLSLLKEKYNEDYNSCILLQPTSPLRSSKHIDEAIELFQNKKADAVVSFTHEFHPLVWNKYINFEGIVEEICGIKNQPTYFPNGALYVLSKKVLDISNYYTDKTYAYLMNRKDSIDIDTQDDWDFAEFLIQKTTNNTEL